MSTIAHNPPRIPTRPRSKVPVWLAAAIPVAAVTLVIALTPSGSDRERTAPSPNESQTAPGVRYDGGPEEGTRGSLPPYPTPERYDGGPEEGTPDVTPRGQAGSRPDGGPEEGLHLRGSGLLR